MGPRPKTGSAHDNASQQAGETRQRRSRKPSAKRSWTRVKDINFRPAGKMPLRDFAAEKDPRNNHERNVVAVYYLETVVEISGIEVGHVLAAYSECGWKAPAIPDNSLMVTASTKGWLDTANMKMIRTTLSGQNFIEYDMPARKASKPA